jgi:hypothetical protein
MGTLALWIVAAVLGLLVWRRHGRSAVWTAMRGAAARAVQMAPRIVMAVLVAGFAVLLLPSGVVAQTIGPESGLSGVMLALLVGGLIPGGASISFSVVVMLNEAGAGMVQLVTLLTAWSVFAVHRVIIHEMPLMGLRFSVIRLLSSLPLPLVAAAITALLLNLMP